MNAIGEADAKGETEYHLIDDLMHEELLPEGSDEPRYRFSKWSLAFLHPGMEPDYMAYRTPRVLATLRWILLIGAGMVFCGSIIDFTRLPEEDAWLLTGIRVSAAIGMLIAWRLTALDWVQRNVQTFIGIGATLIHGVWMVSVPIIGERIYEYDGVLPINIMITFLVSGLMFRFARWVALGATVAYTAVLLSMHPAPVAPILYIVVSGIYAGFAAYVAERARREAWADLQMLDAERERSDQLLLNVLPPSIATRKKREEPRIVDRFEEAAVLFSDIVGFTKMSSEMDPGELVDILDEIFSRFDDITEELDLEKIKTIGDCYMIACGLPTERDRAIWRIAEAALRMQDALHEMAEARGLELEIRIGINCGPVVAGVIGRSKFIYDLWGDTVNVASRMESNAPQGGIMISDAMKQRLDTGYIVEFHGEVDMKGKGLQKTWLITGRTD